MLVSGLDSRKSMPHIKYIEKKPGFSRQKLISEMYRKKQRKNVLETSKRKDEFQLKKKRLPTSNTMKYYGGDMEKE